MLVKGMIMDWQEKLHALNILSECSLKMRKPGDWYVEQNVEICDGKFLKGSFGNGATPAEAVEDHWKQLTLLPVNEWLVVNAFNKEKRRAYRWSVMMWQEIDEEILSVKGVK